MKKDYIQRHNIEKEKIESAALQEGYTHPSVRNGLDPDFDSDDNEQEDEKESEAPNSRTRKGNRKDVFKSKTPALERFCFDFTKHAIEGKFDPVIGREREVTRVMEILSRRKKNNPVLLGDPGVGKTAIVEGLAMRIAERKVPLPLMDKRILGLDLGMLVAGTKYRGEFEERMVELMKDIMKHPEFIVFIDELHMISNTGKVEGGGSDFANLVKPALARGELKCIGATTYKEYSQSIEKDGALDRRFQTVKVEENTPAETLAILQQLREPYEKFHRVSYTDEALELTVELSKRYIQDRAFPDKAIDVIDEAGASTSLNSTLPPDEVESLNKEAGLCKERRFQAVKDQNYELAASWRDREREIREKINLLIKNCHDGHNKAIVNEENIAAVISRMTGIPVNKMSKTEKERLRNLEITLKSSVFGQDEAINIVSKAVKRNRLGLGDENRPIATFLFLGPTGVGKTFLAKQLAKEVFGDENAVIREDMSAYNDSYSISKLIGTTAGYIGYEEGGQFTEKIRRRPYSVVLLDEIEKAHPRIFDLLLPIFDEGAITDGQGRKINFKNTIIIATGNIGSQKVSEYGMGLGFRSSSKADIDNATIRSIVEKDLKKTFRPEFLNRIDATIHFNALTREDIRQIVDAKAKEICDRILRVEVNLVIEPEARNLLAEKGYQPIYGARPVNRLMEKEIENIATELILEDKAKPGNTIRFFVEKEDLRHEVLDAMQLQTIVDMNNSKVTKK